MILNGLDLKAALDKVGVLPDVSVSENTPLLWMHRRLNDIGNLFYHKSKRQRTEHGRRIQGGGHATRTLGCCYRYDARITGLYPGRCYYQGSPYTGSQWKCFYSFQKKRDAFF